MLIIMMVAGFDFGRKVISGRNQFALRKGLKHVVCTIFVQMQDNQMLIPIPSRHFSVWIARSWHKLTRDIWFSRVYAGRWCHWQYSLIHLVFASWRLQLFGSGLPGCASSSYNQMSWHIALRLAPVKKASDGCGPFVPCQSRSFCIFVCPLVGLA